MPFATLPTVRIYYEFETATAKPILMLSNSLGTNLRMWDSQREFEQHFSVLRYDARGQGKSSVPNGPYTIEQMGLDAVALLDLLGLERVHFCGLSMGGMVGQWLGAHAWERLNRLIISNSAAKIGTEEGWNQRIATVEQLGMAAIVPAVLQRWFTAGFRRSNSSAIKATSEMLLATSAVGYSASCSAVRDMDQRADLQRIQAPTLIVFGTEDEVTPPQEAYALAQGILGSRTLPLMAAHLANVEAPEAFTAGVLDFLRS